MSTEQTLASRTFASLPELLALLVPSLSHRDLLQCIQVCRFWNQVFIPHLWCSIHDRTLAWPRFLKEHRSNNNDTNKEDDELIRHIFQKYGGFIQHLDLRNKSMINAATSTRAASSQLCSLRFSRSLLDQYYWESTLLTDGENRKTPVEAALTLALHNQTTLTTLRMDQSLPEQRSSTVPFCESTSIISIIYDTLSKLSKLRELEINDARADFHGILDAAPQLEILRAPGKLQLRNHDGQLLHRTITGGNLKEVELFRETGTRCVFSLLRHLPNLETLVLSGGFDQESFENDHAAAEEAKAVMENMPSLSLRRLCCRESGFMDYRNLMAILPWVPELREFACENLQLRTSQILAEHCKHLEVVRELDTFGGGNDPRAVPRATDVVVPLLTGCPSLRVLDTASHKIMGDSFVNCELVCLGLETFRCQIVGMYWLDEVNSSLLGRLLSAGSGGDDDDDGGPAGRATTTTSAEEMMLFDEIYRNQERHCKMYKQFSRMTKLRVLELGQEWRSIAGHLDIGTDGHDDEYGDIFDEPDDGYYASYAAPIDGTLDLTLVSGFDQLSTLKDLEVFGFEGVDHRMDKVELDWMAVNWPKLKVMRGIHVDIFPKVEPDAKRKELREYMQMLRPDVVHETLYKLSEVNERI
ncbi:hypothetical protein K457DRAFT_138769 [Linnemannia elongata AG-77]|uniref:F-box domain-containing protein n=1 Tax=Linnemannia elongata AG-77 TaxID=1314771 RepID=A0A197JSY3_9FUNG|nr:hypothetical protein K457DRAFT_138769 [Linnemannia elongata AG-77]